MPRFRLVLPGLVLLGFTLGLARADTVAAAPGPGLAVLDFAYIDTSGEQADQTAAHQRRLAALMAALRRDLAAAGGFRLVPLSCGQAPCSAEHVAPAALLRDAAAAGARLLLVGGIHKMSTLIQWAKLDVVDTGSDRVAFEKLYTFRGDSDQAWQRAEAYMAEDIRAALAVPPAVAAAKAPIPLALFDFELEDVSAGAAVTGQTASDAKNVMAVTAEARRLLAGSGRYRLVDVRGAATTAHRLKDCNGCDAAIALKLGARQSLVGVVRRISRTEYTVRFRIRDARTGAVLSDQDSGLRLGADYSWSRGAAILIQEQFLARPAPG